MKNEVPMSKNIMILPAQSANGPQKVETVQYEQHNRLVPKLWRNDETC